MKKITSEDINKLILGTDTKILSIMSILDVNKIDSIPSNLFGVYVLYLEYKGVYIGMYIGMSSRGYGIQSRLSRHLCESWHRKVVSSIDIFITDECYADLLEKILIKTYKNELLQNVMYENFSLNRFIGFQKELESNEFCEQYNIIDNNMELTLLNNCNNEYVENYENLHKYESKYGNLKFIRWLKNQKCCDSPIGDLSRYLLNNPNKNNIKNIVDFEDYLNSINTNNDFSLIHEKNSLIKILDNAYNEYKYIYSTDYKNKTENFGLISIDSLNPILSNQLSNNDSFEYNYKIICKKYDEISTIHNKNIQTTWNELIHKENKLHELSNNRQIIYDEYTESRRKIYKDKDEKAKNININYMNLLSKLNDEIKKLIERYKKDISYIKESYYYSNLQFDIDNMKHLTQTIS